jgi:hypothetical protein
MRLLLQLFGARKILQAALDWDAEYRTINNLGKGLPGWAEWAKHDLGMEGRYAPAAPREREE